RLLILGNNEDDKGRKREGRSDVQARVVVQELEGPMKGRLDAIEDRLLAAEKARTRKLEEDNLELARQVEKLKSEQVGDRSRIPDQLSPLEGRNFSGNRGNYE